MSMCPVAYLTLVSRTYSFIRCQRSHYHQKVERPLEKYYKNGQQGFTHTTTDRSDSESELWITCADGSKVGNGMDEGLVEKILVCWCQFLGYAVLNGSHVALLIRRKS